MGANHNNLRSINRQLKTAQLKTNSALITGIQIELPEILFITPYPPSECGIATYSQDLIKVLNSIFNRSFKVTICALDSGFEKHSYTNEVNYILDTGYSRSFIRMAKTINRKMNIQMAVIEHKFEFFEGRQNDFKQFIDALILPVAIVFHTVFPVPDKYSKLYIQQIARAAASVIVLTHTFADILVNDYELPRGKITVIAHENHQQLTETVNDSPNNEQLQKNMSPIVLQRMALTGWKNAAITHALLFEKVCNGRISLQYPVQVIDPYDIIKKTAEPVHTPTILRAGLTIKRKL